MAYFKYKPNKLKFLTEIKTLDELHREQIDKFDERKIALPECRKELDMYNDQLAVLDQKPRYELTNEDIRMKAHIKTEIDRLKMDINRMERNTDQLEYFYKTGDILFDYYCHDDMIESEIPDEIELSEDETIEFEETITEREPDEMSDKLTKLNEISKQTRKVKKPVKKRRITRETNQGRSILSFLNPQTDETDVPVVEKSSKASLQDQYLMLTNTEYSCDKIKSSPIRMCNKCNTERTLIQSDGIYTCFQCGESEYIIIESEIPSHKDAINEKPKYPYKKINHLIEKLNQYQSKETADIPDKVYTTIVHEIERRRIRMDKVTPRLITSILKKYRMNCYYEHVQHIFSRVTKTPPPILTRELEEKVKFMFKQIQDPFKKYRPPDRSNFLNYSYVLHKIFLILQMPNHSKYFSLLKSREKLRAQDVIWEKICRDLEWPYHKSV